MKRWRVLEVVRWKGPGLGCDLDDVSSSAGPTSSLPASNFAANTRTHTRTHARSECTASRWRSHICTCTSDAHINARGDECRCHTVGGENSNGEEVGTCAGLQSPVVRRMISLVGLGFLILPINIVLLYVLHEFGELAEVCAGRNSQNQLVGGLVTHMELKAAQKEQGQVRLRLLNL